MSQYIIIEIYLGEAIGASISMYIFLYSCEKGKYLNNAQDKMNRNQLIYAKICNLQREMEWIGLDHETMMFKVDKDNKNQAREILLAVYDALKEKGYNPISQIVGYILSGDPTYITNHNNARSVIRKIERDELLEELVKSYLDY